MPRDRRLTLRLELENGQFVGQMRATGSAVDRFSRSVGGGERANHACVPHPRGDEPMRQDSLFDIVGCSPPTRE